MGKEAIDIDQQICLLKERGMLINNEDDKYAPAWKTLEFMTLGGIIHLFKAINDQQIRRNISEHFNVCQLKVFESLHQS